MTNKDILKKQLIYRSTHRGDKEMDLLLGNFVRKYIDKFNDSELKDLKNLIDIEDEILKKWYFDNKKENLVPFNKTSKLFKKFKLFRVI